MPDTETLTLPLLPLTTGVVLPQMVVTLAIESPEARDAADGALATDRRVLLVPRVGTGFANVGTIARIENEGDLPAAGRAMVLRGLARALVGDAGAHRARRRLGQRRARRPRRRPSPAAPVSWLASTAPSCAGSRSGSVRRVSPTRCRASTTSARSPTPPAGRRTCPWSARSSCWRRSTPKPASRRRSRWARDALVGARGVRPDPSAGQRRHGQDPTRLPVAPAALGDPQGAGGVGRGRRRDRRVPDQARGSWQLPESARESITREVDRLERTSEQSPEHGWIRTWIDTALEIPWGERSDDQLDVDRRARASSTPTTPGSTT